METGLKALMQVTCADWCLGQGIRPNGEPTSITDFIPDTGTVTADQFVEWAFLAAHIDPGDATPRWQRAKIAIKEAFIRHLGADSADASAFRSQSDKLSRIQLPLPDPEAFARNLTDDELIQYESDYGSESREWILARREISRRRGMLRRLRRWVAERMSN